VKIKAYDMTEDTHIELTASLTTDHPASSYGQPVMVIDEWDGEAMSHQNWILAGCHVVDLPDDEAEDFERWYSLIEVMTGEVQQ
jgi:hypothetical protein